MAYPNLEAELARANIKQKEVALFLKKDPATICTWLKGGGGGFSIEQAKMLRDRFFPGMKLDYLFDENPIAGNC